MSQGEVNKTLLASYHEFTPLFHEKPLESPEFCGHTETVWLHDILPILFSMNSLIFLLFFSAWLYKLHSPWDLGRVKQFSSTLEKYFEWLENSILLVNLFMIFRRSSAENISSTANTKVDLQKHAKNLLFPDRQIDKLTANNNKWWIQWLAQ